MKRMLTLVLALLLAALLPGQALAGSVRLGLATASPGGTYFVMGSGIANCVTELTDGGIVMTGQTTGGSAENLRLIQGGEVELGIANGSEIYWAWNGELFFEGMKLDRLRIINYLWTNTYHFVTLTKSGIAGPEDFVGKRVGVGPNGSGAAIFAETFLRHIGVWDQITPVYAPPEDQASALKDGNIDVFGYFSGVPMSTVIDLSSTMDVTLIDLKESADASGFDAAYPFYAEVIIPAGTYSGQETDVVSYANMTYLVGSEDVSSEVVQEMLGTLYSEEGVEYMSSVHNSAREMTLENIDLMVEAMGAPVHEGSKNFMAQQ